MKNKNVLIVLGILVVVAIAFFMLNKKFATQKTVDGLSAAAVKSTGTGIDLCFDEKHNPILCEDINAVTKTTTTTIPKTTSTTAVTSAGSGLSCYTTGCPAGTICKGSGLGSCEYDEGTLKTMTDCDTVADPSCKTSTQKTTNFINTIPTRVTVKGTQPKADVTTIQKVLSNYCSSGNIDGIFGALTEACLKYVQTLFNLSVTGKVNIETLNKLGISLRESPTRASTGKTANILPLIQNGFITEGLGSSYKLSDGTNINIGVDGKISFTNIANQRIDLGLCSTQ
jgi:peptidoglycan hydrolase-like protein with peptidoglycan-binding domain